MKPSYNEWRMLIKAIDQNITHSEEQGLPLVSIELNEEEWDHFVTARTTLISGRRNEPTLDLLAGKQIYRGIKIYKEKG